MSDIKVKCAGCGFLAVRHQFGTETVEADEGVRKHGTQRSNSANTTARILCFQGVGNWGDPTSLGVNDVCLVLSQNRTCNKFTEWIPGRTPKEHEEMQLAEIIRLEQAKIRAEDKAESERWRTEQAIYTRLGLCISVIALITSVVVALAQ